MKFLIAVLLVFLKSVHMEFEYAGRQAKKVEFYLATRKYPDGDRHMIPGNIESLKQAGFDSNHPTRILVHGWLKNRTDCINLLLTETYLGRGEYNVIIVDWSATAQTINYLIARYSIGTVSRKLTEFIEFLSQQGVSLSDIYLIGHSLGAHVCGLAARRLKGGKIAAVIALDSAGPLFPKNDPDRIRSSDAGYVQSIHTDGGIKGILEPVGHASFYPNWGVQPQPGCDGIFLFGPCAHRRAVIYFAASLIDRNDFKAVKCSSGFNAILSKRCTNGREIGFLGGDPINTSYKGVFYLQPSKHYLFSKKRTNEECGCGE